MHNRGFTLIELMVSVAIFAVVMVIALGALLAISTADRKAETIGAVMNNLNFAVESMTRTIRTGVDYNCGSFGGGTSGSAGGDCTSGGDYFSFTAANGDNVVYKFDNDNNASSPCGQTGPVHGCIVRSVNAGAYAPITAPEVVITNISTGATGLMFYLRGSLRGTPAFGNPGDDIQPNVVITVTGYVDLGAGKKSLFALQTSATQRLYDR